MIKNVKILEWSSLGLKRMEDTCSTKQVTEPLSYSFQEIEAIWLLRECNSTCYDKILPNIISSEKNKIINSAHALWDSLSA